MCKRVDVKTGHQDTTTFDRQGKYEDGDIGMSQSDSTRKEGKQTDKKNRVNKDGRNGGEEDGGNECGGRNGLQIGWVKDTASLIDGY